MAFSRRQRCTNESASLSDEYRTQQVRRREDVARVLGAFRDMQPSAESTPFVIMPDGQIVAPDPTTLRVQAGAETVVLCPNDLRAFVWAGDDTPCDTMTAANAAWRAVLRSLLPSPQIELDLDLDSYPSSPSTSSCEAEAAAEEATEAEAELDAKFDDVLQQAQQLVAIDDSDDEGGAEALTYAERVAALKVLREAINTADGIHWLFFCLGTLCTNEKEWCAFVARARDLLVQPALVATAIALTATRCTRETGHLVLISQDAVGTQLRCAGATTYEGPDRILNWLYPQMRQAVFRVLTNGADRAARDALHRLVTSPLCTTSVDATGPCLVTRRAWIPYTERY